LKNKKAIFADLKVFAPDKNEIKALLKNFVLKQLSGKEGSFKK
jgi:hypothetical protein